MLATLNWVMWVAGVMGAPAADAPHPGISAKEESMGTGPPLA